MLKNDLHLYHRADKVRSNTGYINRTALIFRQLFSSLIIIHVHVLKNCRKGHFPTLVWPSLSFALSNDLYSTLHIIGVNLIKLILQQTLQSHGYKAYFSFKIKENREPKYLYYTNFEAISNHVICMPMAIVLANCVCRTNSRNGMCTFHFYLGSNLQFFCTRRKYLFYGGGICWEVIFQIL